MERPSQPASAERIRTVKAEFAKCFGPMMASFIYARYEQQLPDHPDAAQRLAFLHQSLLASILRQREVASHTFGLLLRDAIRDYALSPSLAGEMNQSIIRKLVECATQQSAEPDLVRDTIITGLIASELWSALEEERWD
jgi:hypothetical protein